MRIRVLSALAVVIVAVLAPLGASAAPQAVIDETWGDECRDFSARSSKDISHVEIRYADGRVVKDETIESHVFAIDGNAGDEIASAVVKSGVTADEFTCTPEVNGAPTAVVELAIAPDCAVVRDDPPLMHCPSTSARTTWTSFDGPVVFLFGDLCVSDPTLCVFTLRGTSSSDPENNLASWSADLGNGTVVSGDWTNPPTGLTLTLTGCQQFSQVTLTVVDTGGLSDTDTIGVATGNCAD